jgi:hypothetical protein
MQVGAGGALPTHKHYDHGSLITLDVMLSPRGSFVGGELQTLEHGGELRHHHFERGDCLCFVSHKYHSVAPVRGGTRQVCAIGSILLLRSCLSHAVIQARAAQPNGCLNDAPCPPSTSHGASIRQQCDDGPSGRASD